MKAGEEINLIAIDGLVSGLANCNESVAYFGGTAKKFLFVYSAIRPTQLLERTTTTESSVCSGQINQSLVHVTSSSIFLDQATNFGPETVIDGILLDSKGPSFTPLVESYFRSYLEDPLPWLQIDYGCSIAISMVMILPLYNLENGNLANISIAVGYTPAMVGKVTGRNDICSIHRDIIEPRQFKVMKCSKIIRGRYVLIQRLDTEEGNGMSINEIVVFPAIFHEDMETTVPISEITPSASSVMDNAAKHAPQFLTDERIASRSTFFYSSDPSDTDPWIQLILSHIWKITR